MVAVLDAHPHALQAEDGVPPQVVGHVQGRGVEITALVQDFGAAAVGEIEVLQFRSQITGVAFFLRSLGQHAFQGITQVAGIGRAIGLQDVAEHPGHGFFLGAPGQDLKGGGVGLGDHVAFLNAGKSLDGGPVKSHPLSHGLFQLDGRMEKLFNTPRMSVNQIWIKLTSLSRTMRKTSSAVWQVWQCTVFLLNRKFDYLTAIIIPD